MADREDAGVVFEAELREYVEGPQRALHDREIGRPVTRDALANDVFEHVLRSPHVLSELALRLMKDLDVAMAVTRHFVAGAMDASDDVGVRLGEFAEHE
jgi:hypothetical protein